MLASSVRGARPTAGLRPLAARARRHLAVIPLPLILLLIVAAVEVGAWSVATAPFQGPDEPDHFAYAQYVAETGYEPSSGAGPSAISTELSAALTLPQLSSLAGNLPARPAWTSADELLYRKATRALGPPERRNGSGPNPVAQNPPLYYYLQAIPYRVGQAFGGDLFTRLALMRLFNGLFFVATVALVWLLGGALFGRIRWLQTVAAGAVVLEPQLAFMGALVNPDSMLVAEFAAGMLLATIVVKRGPTPVAVGGLAGVCVAGALTHGRGLGLLPAAALALTLALLRHRPNRATTLRLLGLVAGILLAGVALLLALTTGSSGSGGAYGGEVTAVTASGTQRFNVLQFLSGIWQFYLPRLSFQAPALGPHYYGYRQVYIETLLGTFGSLEVRFSATTYDLLQDAAMVGLVAFYTALVTLRRRLWAAWDVALVLGAFFFFELFLLHYDSYRHLLINSSNPIIAGRYLLPLIPLFGLAIAFTVGAMPRRVGPVVAAVILGVGVIFQLGGLGITFARFYG